MPLDLGDRTPRLSGPALQSGTVTGRRAPWRAGRAAVRDAPESIRPATPQPGIGQMQRLPPQSVEGGYATAEVRSVVKRQSGERKPATTEHYGRDHERQASAGLPPVQPERLLNRANLLLIGGEAARVRPQLGKSDHAAGVATAASLTIGDSAGRAGCGASQFPFRDASIAAARATPAPWADRSRGPVDRMTASALDQHHGVPANSDSTNRLILDRSIVRDLGS